MKIVAILNPTAGRGLAARHRDTILDAFASAGVTPEIHETAARGDAESIARENGTRSDVVVAIGGDGTVHEVACGLHGSGGGAALAVIPLGSGNDFASVLGMSSNPKTAVDSILTGSHRMVDLGSATVTHAGGEVSDGLFINACGVGFDSLVAQRATRKGKLRGAFGYQLVAMRVLVDWQPVRISVETAGWTGGGNAVMVTVGNGTRSGGGFYLTPQANIADGLMDVCYVSGMSVGRMLLLLPRVFWGGHVGHPSVVYTKTPSAVVDMGSPLPVHLDGEIVADRAVRVVVETLPEALAVRAPLSGG